MKTLTKATTFKTLIALVMLSMVQTIAWAQDSASSVTESVKKSTTSTITEENIWYGEPWVWVVGVAVLIIIIVALTRGNSSTTSSAGRTDTITHTEKTTRETDI